MYRRIDAFTCLLTKHLVVILFDFKICTFFLFIAATLENMTILEQISPDTILFLQTHKRIWPASQRDALFWSHMRNIETKDNSDAYDEWLVCNHSIDIDEYPANTGKCVRIYLTVILFCQTYVSKTIPKDAKINRDDLTCKITYCSVGRYIRLPKVTYNQFHCCIILLIYLCIYFL